MCKHHTNHSRIERNSFTRACGSRHHMFWTLSITPSHWKCAIIIFRADIVIVVSTCNSIWRSTFSTPYTSWSFEWSSRRATKSVSATLWTGWPCHPGSILTVTRCSFANVVFRSFLQREFSVMKRWRWEDLQEHGCAREPAWYQASILDQGGSFVAAFAAMYLQFEVDLFVIWAIFSISASWSPFMWDIILSSGCCHLMHARQKILLNGFGSCVEASPVAHSHVVTRGANVWWVFHLLSCHAFVLCSFDSVSSVFPTSVISLTTPIVSLALSIGSRPQPCATLLDRELSDHLANSFLSEHRLRALIAWVSETELPGKVRRDDHWFRRPKVASTFWASSSGARKSSRNSEQGCGSNWWRHWTNWNVPWKSRIVKRWRWTTIGSRGSQSKNESEGSYEWKETGTWGVRTCRLQKLVCYQKSWFFAYSFWKDKKPITKSLQDAVIQTVNLPYTDILGIKQQPAPGSKQNSHFVETWWVRN